MNEVFILYDDEELTMDKLKEFIEKHKKRCKRYEELFNLYIGAHKILKEESKANGKPDNRLVVNFAKYIVDTFNGFFMGIPPKVTHEDENISQYLDEINKRNNQDDNNTEISKMCDIYGHSYGLVFTDEDAQPGTSYISPREGFIIYDDSIRRKALYGVRYIADKDGNLLKGSYSDSEGIFYFEQDKDGKIYETDVGIHYFGEVPMVEFIENDERQSAFENVETLINAYNKALSEKANDVDYFADAYLLITGVELTPAMLSSIRDNRTINPTGDDISDIVVQFLDKPNADTTQENLINRLEKLIFQTSMVANINDELFGNSSGIALQYKLQSMSNLAIAKERKFTKGLNKMYELIGNLPNSKLGDEWVNLEYTFTRNMPNNLMDEAQIAQLLYGITSEETVFRGLSNVQDVKQEIERKQKEREAGAYESRFVNYEHREETEQATE